jgi:putative ABC transport system substrate-binding protein
VVGYLGAGSPEATAHLVAAFRKGLSETGYVEGQNVAIEFRWTHNDNNRLPDLAADLVRRRVAVIATPGSVAAGLAAKAATATIPIVFSGGDRVQTGLVASLSRPGGNVTGINSMNSELTAKRLGLLHELIPGAKRFAALVNPNNPASEAMITDTRAAAAARRRQIEIVTASSNRDIDAAFASLMKTGVEALLVAPDPLFTNRRVHLQSLTTRHAVPSIYSNRDFAEAGGLMSYGSSFTDLFSPDRHVCRSHTQGRETGRSAGDAADQVRVRHQPTNGEDARHRNPAGVARHRRRGDRIGSLATPNN